MEPLADDIDRDALEITRQAVRVLYGDPFWVARFGERGRRFSEEDGIHHLRYLGNSMRFSDPSIMVNYALWLRSVLVPRGMCTRHVVQNFEVIINLLVERYGDRAELAERYLKGAIGALRYSNGPAGAVDTRAKEMADDISRTMQQSHPDWPLTPPWHIPSTPDALDILLSYLADALALSRPTILVEYAVWTDAFLRSEGYPPNRLSVLIDAVRAALQALPTHDAGIAQGVIDLANDTLHRGVIG